MSPVANPTRILGSPTFGRNLCGFYYEVAPSVPSMKSAVLDNLLQGRGQSTVRVVMPCSGRKRVEKETPPIRRSPRAMVERPASLRS